MFYHSYICNAKFSEMENMTIVKHHGYLAESIKFLEKARISQQDIKGTQMVIKMF